MANSDCAPSKSGTATSMIGCQLSSLALQSKCSGTTPYLFGSWSRTIRNPNAMNDGIYWYRLNGAVRVSNPDASSYNDYAVSAGQSYTVNVGCYRTNDSTTVYYGYSGSSSQLVADCLMPTVTPSPTPTPYHYACVNAICKPVSGMGDNLCGLDTDCLTPTPTPTLPPGVTPTRTPTSTRTPTPTPIPTNTPTPPSSCINCDINGDGCFGGVDVLDPVAGFSYCDNLPDPPAGVCVHWDVNNNGTINVNDVNWCNNHCSCTPTGVPTPTSSPSFNLFCPL